MGFFKECFHNTLCKKKNNDKKTLEISSAVVTPNFLPGNKMTKKMSSEDIQAVIQNAEVGDLLKFNREMYKHWAVYIGRNRYIHDYGRN